MPERQTAPIGDDLVLARAVAEAVARLPGILEMSVGRFAREGTYGPGEFVRGVVLRHSTPATLEVDVRVILAQQALVKAVPSPGRGNSAGARADARALSLPDLGKQIRMTVKRVSVQMGRQPPVAVNVFFDDVR